VTLGADETTITIAVTDEGSGIYSRDITRIFEPFTQVDGSATRAQGGTGVGLYVCRTLAETLGGRIEVDSVLGKGSTFLVVLPRTAVDTQAPA
jgi:signal transduction histidine kinase